MIRRSRSRTHAGVILIVVALVLLVLMSFVALAVDFSLFYTELAELQIAATSAAAGAALDLPDGATATALRLVEANLPPDVHGPVSDNSDVEVGHWDNSTRTFTAGATPVNAVRVTTQKSNAKGNAANWLVARLLGLDALELTASATATLLPELPGAIGGTGSISLKGNATVDSYDSTAGAYDPATAGDNGDIVAVGSISVGGSATVNGDLKGNGVSSGGNSTVTGSISAPRRPLDFPSVDVTEVAADNDNDALPMVQKGGKLSSPLDADRNFTLSGGVAYEIPPGDYYFNDLKLSGQSSLIVSGPTNIYLTGDLDTSGGDVINNSQDPNNLRIFMTGGSATISASIDWYGLLYAPDSEVTIKGSADIYGAIIGQNVDFGGTGDVHFDESLTLSDIIDGISIRSSVVE